MKQKKVGKRWKESMLHFAHRLEDHFAKPVSYANTHIIPIHQKNETRFMKWKIPRHLHNSRDFLVAIAIQKSHVTQTPHIA